MIKIFFLLLLGVVIGFLITVMQHEGKTTIPQHFFSFPFRMTSTTGQEATLSIVPQAAYHANELSSAQIVIESTDAPVDSVQLELAYNPYYLRNMQVTPGDFFTNPSIPINEVDAANGRISVVFAATDTPADRTSGVVARLSFTPGYVASGSAQNAKVFFLPKTTVYSQNHVPMLSKTVDSILTIR